MNISRQNAMQIVFDISNIINQHINMMDENGLIIASTDPERVGTVHEAAQRIINENLDSLIIHENYEYKGSRKGLNLPILLDNAIVGVIGVTGDYRDVAKYGQIIKKMTEILLLENYSQEQKKIDDRIKTRFLDEWVFEDAPGGCDRAFIDRGNRFGIDEKSTRPHQAYQRAKKALSAGRYAGEPIYFYDDITVEIFMDEISDASRKEFLMRIFRGFGDEEIAYWINFLRVYFANDGSLDKTSSQMFIHKNTVQKKLSKLAERTGHDPRKMMDTALFVLAVQFYENAGARED